MEIILSDRTTQDPNTRWHCPFTSNRQRPPPMTWLQRTRYVPSPHRFLRRRSSDRRRLSSPSPSPSASFRSIDRSIKILSDVSSYPLIGCRFLRIYHLMLTILFDSMVVELISWVCGGFDLLYSQCMFFFSRILWHVPFFINSTHLVWSVSLWKTVYFSSINSFDVLHQLFLLSYVLAFIPLHLFSFWQGAIVTMCAHKGLFFFIFDRSLEASYL